MELRRKITSLTSDNTVAELGEMFDRAHVSISWWGQRLVSVDGYEGSVAINELASKYLRSAPFHRDTGSTLQDRLTCEGLWGRIQKLYTDSDAALANTYIYKLLVPLKEFRPWCRASAGDPMAIIGEWKSGATKNRIFEFTPIEFKTLFRPDAEPLSCAIDGGEDSGTWFVSKEVVESALRA